MPNLSISSIENSPSMYMLKLPCRQAPANTQKYMFCFRFSWNREKEQRVERVLSKKLPFQLTVYPNGVLAVL